MSPPSVLTRLMAVLVAALLPVTAGRAAAGEGGERSKTTATSTLEGRLSTPEGRPLAGVRVVLAPVAGGGPRETITDARGRYAFEGLEFGLYRIAFEREGEAWPANRVLDVPPDRKVEADFTVSGFDAEARDLGLEPGAVVDILGQPATGVARLEEGARARGLSWFRTGTGVAVLVGGAALVVAGLIALSEEDSTPAIEPVASPASP